MPRVKLYITIDDQIKRELLNERLLNRISVSRQLENAFIERQRKRRLF